MEVRDHQQVDEHDGERDATAEARERLRHRLALAADRDARAGRQRAERVDELPHVGGDAPEVAAAHAAVDVDHALHRVVVDDGGLHVLAHGRDVREELRRRARAAGRVRVDVCRGRRAQRRPLERLHRVDGTERRLDRDRVVHVVPWIEPEARRLEEARAERREHARRDGALGDAHLERLRAVDLHAERRVVEELRDADVARPGNLRHPRAQALRDRIVLLEVEAGDLHVDRRGEAEIQNLSDDVRRLRVDVHLREVGSHALANRLHVVSGRAMAGLQCDQHVCVLRAEAVGLVEGEVVRLREPDVVADAVELVRRHDLADRLLDVVDEPLGLLDTRAGRRAEMEPHHAGVDRREEVAADDEQQEPRREHHRRDDGEKEPASHHDASERAPIRLAHPFETRIEAARETRERAVAGVHLRIFRQQVVCHRRHERPRQQVREQHRVHDRERERQEEVLGDAAEEHDRREDDADGERADERRHRDLLRAREDRLDERPAGGVVSVDVLDLDGRVVDEHPDGEREATQRHDVDRLSREREADDGAEDRERDRRDDDERAPRRAEEEQDHQRHERGCDRCLADDAPQRAPHEDRLVEPEADLEPGRRRLPDERDRRLHLVDDPERRRGGVLQDREVRRAPPVDAHDVRLHGVRVGHGRHVAHQHGRRRRGLHGDLVQPFDRRRTAVQRHHVLAVADPHRAAGQDHVAGRERVGDVGRGETLRPEVVRPEVHHDLPPDAAERRRRREALDREQPHADEVQPVVEEVLLGQRVAVHVQLRDRDVRRVVLDDVRRLHARRHDLEDRLRHRRDLRDRAGDVRAVVEVDLDQADAVQRRRLDVLDAVHRRRVGALADEHHAALHVGRGEAGVVPHDDHDRQVDRREDVDVHAEERHAAEHEEQDGEDGDGEGAAEGEADYPHEASCARAIRAGRSN